jgi:hypothetical protein
MQLTKPAGVGFQVVGFLLAFAGLLAFFRDAIVVAGLLTAIGGWMAFEGGKRARQGLRGQRSDVGDQKGRDWSEPFYK